MRKGGGQMKELWEKLLSEIRILDLKNYTDETQNTHS